MTFARWANQAAAAVACPQLPAATETARQIRLRGGYWLPAAA